MVSSEGVGPIKPEKPRENNPEFAQSKELREHAEHIHTTIGYSARDPKTFEKTFLNIAILLHLEEKNILTAEENQLLTEEFRNIRDGINDGSIKIPDLAQHVSKMVEDAKYRNPKAKIIAKAIELEHLICIHPPNDDEPMTFEAFEKCMGPIDTLLKKNLSSIQTTLIYKELEEIGFSLENEGMIPAKALESLQQKCEGIFKKI